MEVRAPAAGFRAVNSPREAAKFMLRGAPGCGRPPALLSCVCMREFPLPRGLRGLATILLAVACWNLPVDAQTAVSLTPAQVEAGSPELIHVMAPATAKLDGEWMGHTLQFFRAADGHGWFALAGVDVEAPLGPSTLQITEELGDGNVRDLGRSVEVLAAHYRTGTLSVAPRFVEPPADAIAEIEAEVALKKKVFAVKRAAAAVERQFPRRWRAEPTDSFGTRRTFNGKLASVHKGMDFRARMGTPVHASNSGVVVLARKLYYKGNCVAIDHGLGLYTISMHLSRIDVREGERVAKGAVAGIERRYGPRDRTAFALGCALGGCVSRSGEIAAAEPGRGAVNPPSWSAGLETANGRCALARPRG